MFPSKKCSFRSILIIYECLLNLSNRSGLEMNRKGWKVTMIQFKIAEREECIEEGIKYIWCQPEAFFCDYFSLQPLNRKKKDII